MEKFSYKNSAVYILFASFLPFQPIYALTISPSSTVGVTESYDPASKSTIFTTTARNANLNNLTISETLSANDVVIRDEIDQDVVLATGTKLVWKNGNNLTINALRHIIVNNGAQINSEGNGDLVLRADARGDTQGTFLYPTNGEPAVLMDGGGTVKVFYRPASFTTPTDFTPTIKTTGFGLMKAFMLINSFADLQNMRLNLAGNYALARNIDAQGLTFAPIGNSSTPFTGHFDGQGYLINRLYISQNNSYVGLFGYTLNATIEDVGLINANVLGNGEVGGLIGRNEVTSPSFFQGSVRRTFVIGNVSGRSDVGGLIGNNYQGTIAESFSEGGVSVTGPNPTNSRGGGLVGVLFGAIVDGYSKSNVNSAQSVYLGGLYGRDFVNISCANSYATGSVQGDDTYSGGIIGNQTTNGSFFNVFWDKSTSGRNYPAANRTTPISGITGLETADMLKKETYENAGWDFVNVWGMEEGKYPYLLWTKRTAPWTSIQDSVTKAYRIVG